MTDDNDEIELVFTGVEKLREAGFTEEQIEQLKKQILSEISSKANISAVTEMDKETLERDHSDVYRALHGVTYEDSAKSKEAIKPNRRTRYRTGRIK